MKNVELQIYDRNINFRGIIDVFESLRWRRKYYEAGEFELHLKPSVANIFLFKRDMIIHRDDCRESGIIENIEIKDTGEKLDLVVTGNFLSYILARRIIKSRINYTGTILGGMRKLLSSMRQFSILDVEDTDIESNDITFQCTYKNVYKYICKLSKASGIGFGIFMDIENKRLKFENFIGVDRTEQQDKNFFYKFSEEYSNLAKVEYLESAKNHYNYAIVGGEGEGDERVLVTIDNTTEDMDDFDIREIFVDAKDERKEDLTNDKYEEILINKGDEKLEDVVKNIDFEVYSDDYKSKWDLGDITTVEIESWNIQENLRIIEVEEVYEGASATFTPTFGMPLKESFVDDDE